MKRSVALILLFVILLLSCVFGSGLADVADKRNDKGSGVMLIDEHLVEVEQEMNPLMADYAITLFSRIYSEQLGDNKCYFALIPDKYKYLSNNEKEYQEFYDYMCSGLDFATPIGIYDLLSEDDYYRTDPHWRQEKIVDVAQRIISAMGAKGEFEFEENVAMSSFDGNYARRSNIQVATDELCFLSNDVISTLAVDGGISVYDYEYLNTDEPYNFFLSGNQPVVTMTNHSADTDRRLIIFRDSFASSIAPLMCEGYREIVLVDLRYIMSDLVPGYVDFDNADVLFLYSTLLLNNSMSMK